MRHFFYSIMSFALSLFFLVLGMMGMLLAGSMKMRDDLARLLHDQPIALFLLGFGFLTIGTLLLINVVLHFRRKYYRLRAGPSSILIDEFLIQEYVNIYWMQLFPKASIASSLHIKNNQIHLSADLPYVPADQQKELLEKIRNDLTQQFTSFLGYHHTFYLTASFDAASKELLPQHV